MSSVSRSPGPGSSSVVPNRRQRNLNPVPSPEVGRSWDLCNTALDIYGEKSTGNLPTGLARKGTEEQTFNSQAPAFTLRVEANTRGAEKP